MHSKWKVWDFFKSNTESISLDQKGFYSFYSADPIFIKFFIDQIPKSEFENKKLNILIGDELKSSWIDDNLQSLGLFGNADSYLVHYSEKITKDIQDKILNDDLIVDERFFIFIFQQQNDFYKDLVKSKKIQSIELSPVMFWENKELLEFLSSKLKVYLSYEASQIIIDSVEASGENYFNLLNQLKLNFDGETIDKDKLLQILSKEKVDIFEFSSLFSSKKFHAFYELCDERLDSKSSYGMIGFMQSHLIKMLDTSYLDNKKKLSKYDRQILADSKLWSKEHLIKAINYFKNLEEINREHGELFQHLMRRDLLKSF